MVVNPSDVLLMSKIVDNDQGNRRTFDLIAIELHAGALCRRKSTAASSGPAAER